MNGRAAIAATDRYIFVTTSPGSTFWVIQVMSSYVTLGTDISGGSRRSGLGLAVRLGGFNVMRSAGQDSQSSLVSAIRCTQAD
jgi:hypothetical protein